MFCKNCGSEVNESLLFCTNCGAPVNNSSNDAVNSTSYSAVNEPIQNNTVQNGEPIKTTGLLVWSIIEIFCVNFITGIIAIILYFVNLKPAVESGNREAALKSKKTIKIVLWIGIALFIVGIVLSIIGIVLVTLPIINSASDVGLDARSELDDLQSMLDSMESSSYSSTYDDYDPYSYDFDF